MKKTFDLIIIFITFLLLYFIQTNFFSWFNIMGIKPNIFIIFAVFLGLFLKTKYSFTISTICGLLVDLFIGKMIGLNAISLGVASWLGNKWQHNFSKENKITIIIATSVSTLICELIVYCLQITILNVELDIYNLVQIILIEIIYNAIIVIIAYSWMKKLGMKLEQNFHNNIFKSYF